MYGSCISCGFPISVQDSSPVSCPFCETFNQPIANSELCPPTRWWLWLLLGFAGGVLVKGGI